MIPEIESLNFQGFDAEGLSRSISGDDPDNSFCGILRCGSHGCPNQWCASKTCNNNQCTSQDCGINNCTSDCPTNCPTQNQCPGFNICQHDQFGQ